MRTNAETEQAPRFATSAEANQYRAHLEALDPAVGLEIAQTDQSASHEIADGLLRRLGSEHSVPEVVEGSTNPEIAGAGYDLALELRVAEIAEQGGHAVAWSPVGVSSNQQLAVVLTPGDATSVWQVLFESADDGYQSSRFWVDVAPGFMAAPGMTPDPKSGYVMWDADESRVVLVYSDPDRSALEAVAIDDFDGDLPEEVSSWDVEQVSDLAQLVADIATGWRA